jgi:hypothetical protein
MTITRWILFLAGAALLFVGVRYLYARRETPGQGRPLLATLRWGSLALLLLLLFDPQLRAPGAATGPNSTRVLIDNSISMTLPVASGGTRWQRAVAEARKTGSSQVIVFGDIARAVSVDSLAAMQPNAPTTRLLPALQAASEAGVRKVVLITDGGIEDTTEVARWLPRLGLDLEMHSVGPTQPATIADRALAEVEAPAWAEAGKPIDVRVGVTSTGAAGQPVIVGLKESGRRVAQTQLLSPGPGRIAGSVIRFTPQAPKGGGLVRYDVAVEPDDASPGDDHRTVYIAVSEKPAGTLILSFRPDWEPRFLAPVLEQALGLPARGYFLAGSGRFYTIGPATDAGREATEQEVRAALRQANLVVMHGLGPASPQWARDAVKTSRHLLLFPAPEASDIGLPVSLPPTVVGEWFPTPDLPPSPIAPLLTSVPLGSLPPISSLRPLAVTRATWAPVLAGNGRRAGPTSPLVLGGETDGRRWVIAPGEGYWRWAFRGDSARDAYRRVWSAVAGWIVEDDRTIASAAIRPADRVVARGEQMQWISGGLAADSIRLHITNDSGGVVLDTAVTMLRGDSSVTRGLPPGNYTYRAAALRAGKEVGSANGPFTVESYSPEFARGAVTLANLKGKAAPLDAALGMNTQPLRASVWPYLLLILLLCAEWTLRRRWGLR